MSVYQQWIDAKEMERLAIETRRKIEDQLIEELRIVEDLDGTANFERDDFKIKVTGRMNRKVDGDKAQEIATELGLSDHLASLFRWKPEINLSVWKATDKSITDPLLEAVTTTPGRPSFSITKGE